MTAPVPEEDNAAIDVTEEPADEHASEAPDVDDAVSADEDRQEENAGTSADQPSS